MATANISSDFHKDLPTVKTFFCFHALEFVVAVHALSDGFGFLILYTAEQTDRTAGKESATSVTFVDALTAL